MKKSSANASPLRSIGQEIEQVRAQFAESGAVGLLVIDAMSLDEIERCYGVGARRFARQSGCRRGRSCS